MRPDDGLPQLSQVKVRAAWAASVFEEHALGARVINNTSQTRPIVILVDDDPAVLSALQFSLELDGFEVRGFRDSISVLKSADLPRKGCLVLDYNMPALNGLELLERLRQAGIDMPAILMTASPTRLVRERARQAGVSLIEKPFFDNELSQGVRHLVASASQENSE